MAQIFLLDGAGVLKERVQNLTLFEIILRERG